jgi:hypothetical protein
MGPCDEEDLAMVGGHYAVELLKVLRVEEVLNLVEIEKAREDVHHNDELLALGCTL